MTSPLEAIAATTKVSEVVPLQFCGYLMRTRSMVSKFVEAPLVAACEHLYDLRVQTQMSSANMQNVGGYAWITCDLESLSEGNTAVVDELVKEGMAEKYKTEFQIQIPLSIDATVEEISREALTVAQRFTKQPLLWSQPHTLKEYIEGYTQNEWSEEQLAELDPDEVFGDSIEYWDPELQLVFASKDHYSKIQEDIATGLISLERT